MNSWILRHQKTLRLVWFVLVLVCVAEVISLRSARQVTFERTSLVFLWALPFFAFAVVQLALMYGGWVQANVAPTVVGKLKRGLFWILLVAFAVASVAFVRYFAFPAP